MGPIETETFFAKGAMQVKRFISGRACLFRLGMIEISGLFAGQIAIVRRLDLLRDSAFECTFDPLGEFGFGGDNGLFQNFGNRFGTGGGTAGQEQQKQRWNES